MTTPFPFVAAQVLTASELNSITNLPSSTKTVSYVLTLANAGARVLMNAAGSTTITVNTSIFSAGDLVELSNIGAGTCTVTAGTATVSSAGPLAIPQYGGGQLVFTSASAAIYFPSAVTAAAPPASALTFIASGSLSGTSTTFSNAFSATYDNYLVNINALTGSSGYPEVKLTFGAATSNYSYCNMYANALAAWSFGTGSASAAFIYVNQLQNTTIQSNTIRIMSPFMTEKTTVLCEGLAYTASQWQYTGGAQFDATSFTAFTLASSTAATLSGTVRIYGYANS